jgi:hypothetical protein
MLFYVLQDGKPTGPFEEAEIISRWRKGILKDTDLVWTEGLDEWMPLAKLLSVSNSTQILPKNDESHSEEKTEPNSVKWYERWQTWVATTATAFVLWLVLTAHPAQQGSAKFRADNRSSTASPTEVPTGQRDFVKLPDEHNNPTSAPPSPSPADDLVASFQRGVMNLEQRKLKIFTDCTGSSSCVEIRYDIKKTDSLAMPIVGIVNVRADTPAFTVRRAIRHEFLFSYHNGRWTLAKHVYWDVGDGLPVRPSEDSYITDLDKSVQECFKVD